MQMYEFLRRSTPNQRKKLSYSTLLTSGRSKQIKQMALLHLEVGPLTARQLSENIPCLRSSVCGALNELSKLGMITNTQSIYDDKTERSVTLYSLVETSKVTILSV